MSTDPSPVAVAMKEAEAKTRLVLPRQTYTIIRVDGRAFHSYTRGLKRPYDTRFMGAMDLVAETLLAEVSGGAFAYTQSDEISVLLTDFATPTTEPWFGGVVNKMVSVSASIASATMSRIFSAKPVAVFDARAFTLDTDKEVESYFRWRQVDCVRNSVSMAAQSVFSSRELIGVKVPRMKELLRMIDRPWEDMPQGFRLGRLTKRVTTLEDVTYTRRDTGAEVSEKAYRNHWVTESAPDFSDPLGLLPWVPMKEPDAA